MTHAHLFRARPGAGWRCIVCDYWVVTPPPPEQRASSRERAGADDDAHWLQEQVHLRNVEWRRLQRIARRTGTPADENRAGLAAIAARAAEDRLSNAMRTQP